MLTKLSSITPSFHAFEPSQVLTHKQLNEFLDYFEDQDRLSRICLSGVGIVCGFTISQEGDNLCISKGTAVTTDGDLLKFLSDDGDGNYSVKLPEDKMVFSHAKEFQDNEAKYDHFRENKGSSKVQIPLLELVSADEANESLHTALPKVDLASKFVVLYLENYQKASTACTTITCDGQGVEIVRKLRVLLVDKFNINVLLSQDSVLDGSLKWQQQYQSLEDIKLPRVIVKDDNSNSLVKLANSYNDFPLRVGTKQDLLDNLEKILNALGMSDVFNFIETTFLTLFSGKNKNVTYFQYRYDFFKDVVDAYNELRKLYVDEIQNCCTDITAFPKHVILGAATSDDSYSLRHSFYPSPIIENKEEKLRLLKESIERIVLLCKDFELKPEFESSIVKVTPSRLAGELGLRAIPFYYGFPNQDFRNYWNPMTPPWKKQETPLGYYSDSYGQKAFEKEPLLFNLDETNFLRIEGCQGLDYREALAQIDEIKKAYGLSFDVKAMAIQQDDDLEIDFDEYFCDFHDLSFLLNAWQKEQDCGLQKAAEYLASLTSLKETLGEEILMPVKIEGIQKAEVVSAKSLLGKETQKRSRNIFEEIPEEDDTVGKLVKDLIEKDANGYQRKEDNSKFEVDLNKALDDIFNKFPDDYTVFPSVSDISTILTLIFVLGKSTFESLNDLTDDNVTDYLANSKGLCEAAAKLKVGLSSVDGITVQRQSTLELAVSQLNSFCCSAEKIAALATELNGRKERIIENLVLSNFVKKHPGLEHKAGVEPGGTFILVYIAKTKGDFLREGFRKLPANIVVADFSLPYSCFSDCTPVNFVIPPPEISLVLADSNLCIDSHLDENIEISYVVSPVDGLVQIANDTNIDGITIESRKLTISTKNFTPSQFGEPIYFNVNDIPTTAQLTIYDTPKIDSINHSLVSITKEIRGAVTLIQLSLNFDLTLIRSNDVYYDWTFDKSSLNPISDNTKSIIASPTEQFRFIYEEGVTNVVKVISNIALQNGGCTGYHEVEIDLMAIAKDYYEKNPELTIGDKFCLASNEKLLIPYTVFPVGAILTFKDPSSLGSDMQILQDEILIKPYDLDAQIPIWLDKPIELLLDGKEIGANFTVCKKPSAGVTLGRPIITRTWRSIRGNSHEIQFTFTPVESGTGFTFEWQITYHFERGTEKERPLSTRGPLILKKESLSTNQLKGISYEMIVTSKDGCKAKFPGISVPINIKDLEQKTDETKEIEEVKGVEGISFKGENKETNRDITDIKNIGDTKSKDDDTEKLK